MTHKRNQRALHIIRTLRRRQSKLNQKVDILCQDMTEAHGLFSQKLQQLTFSASFYETLLGCNGLDETLEKVVMLIRDNIEQSGAAVFLIESSGFDVHVAKGSDSAAVEKTSFQSWFSPSMVQQISQTNRICTLNEMLRLGLAAPPSALRTLSAAAVPLGRFGMGVGFILIYRTAEYPLLAEELARVAGVAPGLREAIVRYKTTPTTIKT